MERMQIKGLLFDLGGTLFSYSRRGKMGQALFSAASALEIDAAPAEIGQAWSRASAQTMQRFAQRDFFMHRDLFRDSLAAFASHFDKPLDAEVADRFEADQRAAVVENLPIREDCHDTLEALKSRGLYLAIVSNIDDDYLDPLVDRHQLHRWLDHWTSSEEAASCKPHGAIYHYSLEKAGLDVSEALFVGDSLHHDVAGASAVGMRSVRIAEEGVETPLTSGLSVTAEPDYQIAALNELIAIVDNLNDQSG